MSDTDIYKKREPMPIGTRRPKHSGRRRRSNREKRPFDDQNRKRRSRNSGFRRLLHLYRKRDNEKIFWWSLFISTLVLLVGLAVWQFVIREATIRQQEKGDDYIEYQQTKDATSVAE
ncbi:MAG: hypothetical protein JXR25_15230 [Pontiellaceae bacterium]|nr:hypothetical protein [Pontiellaceae bacterium]MBN2786173.1 hypothetical protein [Pontiellaceae bacterium]